MDEFSNKILPKDKLSAWQNLAFFVEDPLVAFVRGHGDRAYIPTDPSIVKDYIKENHQRYLKTGKAEISPLGLRVHEYGYLVSKFKEDYPTANENIKVVVGVTGKTAGIIVDSFYYVLGGPWEVYRDAVNEYLVPDAVNNWINDQATKAISGFKRWEQELTSKQQVALDASKEGVKFVSDLLIIGSAVKMAKDLDLPYLDMPEKAILEPHLETKFNTKNEKVKIGSDAGEEVVEKVANLKEKPLQVQKFADIEPLTSQAATKFKHENEASGGTKVKAKIDVDQYDIEWGKQGKHIEGHNNFQASKGIITLKSNEIELLKIGLEKGNMLAVR